VVSYVKAGPGGQLPGLSVRAGLSEEAARSLLGKPDEVEEGELHYWCDPGAESRIQLKVVSGTVTEVIYSAWPDARLPGE